MDDLDDLLDDIEKSLNEEDTKSNRKLPRSTSTTSSKLKTQPRTQTSVSVDEDLSDILDDDFPPLNISKPSKTTKHVQVNQQYRDRTVSAIAISSKSKCRSVLIGGSSYTPGQATLKERRTCNNLRCTNCDFKVIQINDCEWHSSVDYLFLRNNMPDFNRIKSKLVKRKGSRAYACQCSWKTATSAVELKSSMGLKWVCGRH